MSRRRRSHYRPKTVVSRLKAANARIRRTKLYRQARYEYQDAKPYLNRAGRVGGRVGRASFRVGSMAFNAIGETGYHLMYDTRRPSRRPKTVYVYRKPTRASKKRREIDIYY